MIAKTQRGVLRVLVLALLTVLLSGPALLASAADQVAFTIGDARITESSGLARDTAAKLYWTVNDSGDEGTVYGLTTDGNVKGVLGFRSQPVDVEAVAMSGKRLYVGDIGDNGGKRDFVSVYYFTDPQANNTTVSYRSYDFSYPDGPHDAETLLVDGRGRLYLVTKGLRGGIYAAPKEPSRQGVNKLTRVADAPPFVTDGVFLPDDNKIVLRTYVSVEVLDTGTYKTVARAATPFQRQGESVAVSLDGKSLLVGSEGKQSQVLKMAIPAAVGAAPSPGSAPPKTALATPGATTASDDPANSADPDADEEAQPATDRTGTILALSLAAFVALVAGVVVAAARRR